MASLDLSTLPLPLLIQFAWTRDDAGDVGILGHLRAIQGDRLTVRPRPSVIVPVRLRDTDRLSLLLETDDGQYSGTAAFLAFDQATGDLHLRADEAITRVQRRQFARARVALPTLPALVLDGAGRSTNRIEIKLLDLSGGGARLVCGVSLRRDSHLQLLLPITRQAPMVARLVVIESRRVDSGGPAPSATRPTVVTQINVDTIAVQVAGLPDKLRPIVEHYASHAPAAPATGGRRSAQTITLERSTTPGWLVTALTNGVGLDAEHARRAREAAHQVEYIVRGRFEGLSDQDRERIVQYVARFGGRG